MQEVTFWAVSVLRLLSSPLAGFLSSLRGETCSLQNWTYRLRPDREDLVLEGRPQRRTLLWSGSSIRCSGCIILQEIEPALSEMDSEDSLGRFMLYSRQPDGNSEVVATFLKNWDCNGSSESVKPPQKQGFCA
ncbi:apolipoprotein M-like [Menidia menidia]